MDLHAHMPVRYMEGKRALHLVAWRVNYLPQGLYQLERGVTKRIPYAKSLFSSVFGIYSTDVLLMIFRRPFSDVKHKKLLDSLAICTKLSRYTFVYYDSANLRIGGQIALFVRIYKLTMDYLNPQHLSLNPWPLSHGRFLIFWLSVQVFICIPYRWDNQI